MASHQVIELYDKSLTLQSLLCSMAFVSADISTDIFNGSLYLMTN
ncbi:hypothetical protein [Thiothrix subterranea]|nr:hypothetical protein [Thiothrix subterranea]